MIDKKNMRFALFIAAALLIVGSYQSSPKLAVADVDGQACTLDEECPCWGEISGGGDAYGVGVSSCNAGVCDTTYCVDVEPVGTWLKDNPWQWVKDNVLISVVALGLLIWGMTLPKG